MARRLADEIEAPDPYVAVDDRGRPVPPIRRLCLAYRNGRRVPAIDGASVVHADAFGRLVRRSADDADDTFADGTTLWRLVESPTDPDLAAAIVEHLDRRRHRGRPT